MLHHEEIKEKASLIFAEKLIHKASFKKFKKLKKNILAYWENGLHADRKTFVFELAGISSKSDEFGLHYKFRKLESGWKLVEVYCVG